MRIPLANEMLFARNDATIASGQVVLTMRLIIGNSAINAKVSATTKKSVRFEMIAGNTNHTKGRVMHDATTPVTSTRMTSLVESKFHLRRKKNMIRTRVSNETVNTRARRNSSA
jgi:hypothetical protein